MVLAAQQHCCGDSSVRSLFALLVSSSCYVDAQHIQLAGVSQNSYTTCSRASKRTTRDASHIVTVPHTHTALYLSHSSAKLLHVGIQHMFSTVLGSCVTCGTQDDCSHTVLAAAVHCQSAASAYSHSSSRVATVSMQCTSWLQACANLRVLLQHASLRGVVVSAGQCRLHTVHVCNSVLTVASSWSTHHSFHRAMVQQSMLLQLAIGNATAVANQQ
eukprot:10574-Heterococcus_DN1.PRE.1